MKTSSRAQLARNILKGKIAERLAQSDYQEHGYKIFPTAIGSDFVAIRKTNGKLFKEFVEVKLGSARLSKFQKRKRIETKKTGNIYTIYRVSESFLSNHLEANGGKEK